MSEKIGSRTVHVEASMNVVIADFKDKAKQAGSNDYHVAVELTEAELRLTGAAFIAAAREALMKTLLIGDKVMIYRNGIIVPSEDTQTLGFLTKPDNIELKDIWRPAEAA